jgi:hypothetical protein
VLPDLLFYLPNNLLMSTILQNAGEKDGGASEKTVDSYQ